MLTYLNQNSMLLHIFKMFLFTLEHWSVGHASKLKFCLSGLSDNIQIYQAATVLFDS